MSAAVARRWEPAMALALAEARAALAHGDVPIGAVVLDAAGSVVARAHNERELTGDPTAHAEVLALRRAAEELGRRGLVDRVGPGVDRADSLAGVEGAGAAREVSGMATTATGDRAARADRGASDTEGAPDWRLADCTLVVTLEPCTMCAGALVNARVGRLVFGAYDPKAGAVASLWDVVRDPRLNHRVEVTGGVRAQESSELLRGFFGERRG